MFDSYEFTEEEEKVAKHFSDFNILYLYNLRHEAIRTKLELKFDPTQPHVFQQNEAMLTGKIDVLTLLIGD
jgi:hypothetical protein